MGIAHNRPRLPWTVILALIIGVFALGFSGLFVKWAGAPGLVSSFYRMAIATVVMAWPFFRQVRAKGGLPRRGVLTAAGGGIFFALDLGLWTTGIMISGVTSPTILANTAPLWVGLGALFLFRQRPKPLFWVGVILAVFGAGTILGLDSLKSANFGLGSLLGLAAGFFYGGYYLFTQSVRASLDSLESFWIATASSTVVLFFSVLIFGQPLDGYAGMAWLNFVAAGLFSQVAGYLAINYALGYLPASIVAPTMLGQPVLTALLAWPLLGEALGGWQAFSGLVVLTGIYLVHRSR